MPPDNEVAPELTPVPITTVPVAALDTPVRRDSAPLDAPPATPLAIVTEPLLPALVVPVDSSIPPVAPAVTAFAVEIMTAPEEEPEEPDNSCTLPPVSLPAPAARASLEPAALLEVPTTMEMSPPDPPVATPEVMRT